MFERTAYCKIHPAVGIARVGNSPNGYFIGPEIPGVFETPIGGFKDVGERGLGIPPRIKRQAARFRIFAYDEAGVGLGEITLEDAEIEWSVHLVNSKAEGDRFAGTAGEELPLGERRPRDSWRNADIDDRASLVIDPGERHVTGQLQEACFDGGTFRGTEVPLGHIRTDEDGRLLVLGGFGKSASSNPGQTISNYANNDRWHDDVSDGPVKARVTLKSGRAVDVQAAWVVVAPPDFAPSVSNVITLYDVAVDVALRHELGPVPGAANARPSFTRDIAPIFDRLSRLAWVQDGARGAGTGGSDFANLDELAAASLERRKIIFERFRNPNLALDSPEAKKQASSDFVPALSGDSGDAAPNNPANWLSLTKTQYEALGKWRDGNCDSDWKGSFPEPSKEISPDGLDRAAYEACSGGAFYPGIEGGWLLRNPHAYEAPFRLSHARLRPGDVTRHMACPWQADFFECRWHWWPAQRPDEVLTIETYRRLREIEDLLTDMDPSDRGVEILRQESLKLLKDRSSWTRGMPDEDPEGDLAMIERWSQQGFVVTSDQYGGAFKLPDGSAALVETERERYDGLSWGEYFHILTNIEQHPEFLPKAKQIARQFFAGADYSEDNYSKFEYSPDALDDRFKTIYDAFVDKMNDRSRMDTGLIQWPIVVRYDGDREITKDITFDVKPFSDRAIKERIRQRAPFNLVDGAWLQRIQAAGPVDEIRSHLFAIWDDEAGNGRAEQNHCNVYDTLLRSVNVYMPPITARKFVEQGLLDSAFVQPVFQLAVSLFPDEFFPELLGMTLYLEWEATPTLTPTVRSFKERGIDPHFYSLHVAIDNITAGHGFMAKEAVKMYLQKVEDESGGEGVRQAWSRIWSGYVTWATAGDLGTDLLELCMIIDRKQIDLAYPAMLRKEQIADRSELAAKLREAALGGGDPFPRYLVGRFGAKTTDAILHSAGGAPLQQALLASIVDELNRLVQDEESFFSADRFTGIALGEDTQKLLAKVVSGEDLVRLNRLLLRDGFPGIVAGIPELKPVPFPDYRAHYKKAFIALIKSKAYAAKPLHREVMIGEHILAEMFDDPERLVEVLAGSNLIDISHPRSSRLFEAMSFSGPMYKIFTEEEKTVILDWIESMQEGAAPAQPVPEPSPEDAARKVLALIETHRKVAGNVQRHAQYQVGGKSLKDWFDDPRGLMAAFANSADWVVPGSSDASRLFVEFSTGKMAFMGAGEVIRQWIDTGAAIPPQLPADHSIAFSTTALPLREHLSTFLPIPDGPVPANVAVAPAVKRIRSDFANRRKLLGMGSVH
ncbi:LodA/GoxA family CTQ-dependent oxidase [Bradyrhizobium barranii subsp. barranii]|uniref:Iron-containing redox enzyme family protein n=1 Tax=Bradyrhizobium barranii subsp. barranii TaxID=2823807 RepID=A0A7Z0TPS4_9BRAD|nr:LodA/GoxA family CTQ-dependent oxidase [Bradyrhizobium barranii]UGX94277.1 LodA/GoxA family CTQ-dependent oxidase [Bradyrhizobium barranii subsp. barranii]